MHLENETNMTKLGDYLEKQKIDPRRVLVASKKLEALRPEDRVAILAKRSKKKSDDAAKPAEGADGADAKKRRSGKPVSRPTLDAALRGESISGPAKTRIVRAVNHVLAAKKKGEVALRDVF